MSEQKEILGTNLGGCIFGSIILCFLASAIVAMTSLVFIR